VGLAREGRRRPDPAAGAAGDGAGGRERASGGGGKRDGKEAPALWERKRRRTLGRYWAGLLLCFK
jgi:hypothetical protein